MGIRAVTGLVLGALCAPAFAVSEERVTLADLSRGDRVRLRLSSGGGKVRGTIDAAGPEEIVVRPKDPAQVPLRLSPPQMEMLEVVRGRRSRWLGGAIIGFVPGAFLGAAAAVGLSECDPDCDHTDRALGWGLVTGAVTGTVGALVGLAIKTDRWVSVERPRPKVVLSLAPARGGFRAGLAVSF
jgi:hypothetical protein